jgi:bifunctional non-homologous end joining protein LigD
MIFDVLAVDGESLTALSFARRRDSLEQLGLDGPAWTTPDTFDDGHALYDAVCDRGLAGFVAKWRRASSRLGQRGLIKVKNPAYWRRPSEMAAMKSAEVRCCPGKAGD